MAIDFNGSTHTLSLASPVFSWTNYYLSLWFNADTLKDAVLWKYFGFGPGLTAYEQTVGITAGGTAYVKQIYTTFLGTSGGQATTANTYSAGEWNHLLVRCDNSTSHRSIILNAGTEATNTDVASSSITPGTLYVASNNGTSGYFDGRLAEVAEWDDDLSGPDFTSASWAAQLYNGRATAAHLWPSYMLRYYLFDRDYNSWVRGVQTMVVATSTPAFASGPLIWHPWATGGVSRPRRRIRLDDSLIRV